MTPMLMWVYTAQKPASKVEILGEDTKYSVTVTRSKSLTSVFLMDSMVRRD